MYPWTFLCNRNYWITFPNRFCNWRQRRCVCLSCWGEWPGQSVRCCCCFLEILLGASPLHYKTRGEAMTAPNITMVTLFYRTDLPVPTVNDCCNIIILLWLCLTNTHCGNLLLKNSLRIIHDLLSNSEPQTELREEHHGIVQMYGCMYVRRCSVTYY